MRGLPARGFTEAAHTAAHSAGSARRTVQRGARTGPMPEAAPGDSIASRRHACSAEVACRRSERPAWRLWFGACWDAGGANIRLRPTRMSGCQCRKCPARLTYLRVCNSAQCPAHSAVTCTGAQTVQATSRTARNCSVSTGRQAFCILIHCFAIIIKLNMGAYATSRIALHTAPHEPSLAQARKQFMPPVVQHVNRSAPAGRQDICILMHCFATIIKLNMGAYATPCNALPTAPHAPSLAQ